jgi:N-acetylglucosamine kinase-like BadF-type ATPase
VAVIAGAGSIALARTQDGREGRAGGWGYLLGDEGSGYWIGREALIAYLRMLERQGTSSPIAELVAAHTRTSTVVDTLGWLYRGTDQVARLAALAPLVSEAANAGDSDALHILQQAGSALADLAATAVRQVFAEQPQIQVVTIGGVWSAGSPLEKAFNASLGRLLPTAKRAKPRLLPVGGSLLLAMGAERSEVDASVVQRLSEHLQS